MEKLVTRAFGFAFTSNLLMGLTFALFIHYAGFLVSLGATEATVGLIVGVGSIGSLIVRPYVGQLMDKIGRRPLIHAGNIINVAGLAALTTVTSISWWVYALTVVHGIAEAVLFTSFVTYTADIVPASRRTEGMALFGVSGQMPLALGGLLGDFILRTSSYTMLFWVAAALGTAAFLMALPLPESKGVHTRPSLGFLVAIRQRELSPIWLITAAFSLTLISIFTFLKTFIDTTGYGSVRRVLRCLFDDGDPRKVGRPSTAASLRRDHRARHQLDHHVGWHGIAWVRHHDAGCRARRSHRRDRPRFLLPDPQLTGRRQIHDRRTRSCPVRASCHSSRWPR